jgi:hypothetical protein
MGEIIWNIKKIVVYLIQQKIKRLYLDIGNIDIHLNFKNNY